MRIHIIKVLKYTNSILARFSSCPSSLPSLLSSSSAQNPSECARSSGTIESEEWIVAVVSAALSYPAAVPALQPCRCRKKQNFSNYSSSSSSSASACWRSVGNREGSEERVQEGAEGTLFIVGRTKEEEGLSKERGRGRGRDQMFSHCMK